MERDLETWENKTRAKIWVRRFRGDTNEEQSVLVGPGQSILITPQERLMLNSDRAYAEEGDVFKNGMLMPVKLAKSSSDLEENPNPNHMSESDLKELFKERNHMSFRKTLKDFDTPQILRTLAYIAANDDDADATVSQIKAIDDRLDELTGTPDVSEIEVEGEDGDDDDRSGVRPFKGI